MTRLGVSQTQAIVKEENNEKKYALILAAMVPLVNGISGDEDGAVTFDFLAEQTDIQTLLAYVPPGFEKRLKIILGNYKDYFAVVDEKWCVTYVGYQTGKVNNQGVVDEYFTERKRGTAPPAGVDPFKLSNSAGASKPGAVAKSGSTIMKKSDKWAEEDLPGELRARLKKLLITEEGYELSLIEAADKMYQAIWLDDAEEFDLQLRRVQALREKSMGPSAIIGWQRLSNWRVEHDNTLTSKFQTVGALAAAATLGRDKLLRPTVVKAAAVQEVKCMPQLPPCRRPGEKELRKRLMTREIIKVLHDAPDNQLTSTQIFQCPKINMLKKYAIIKMTTYLEENQDKFQKKINPHDPGLPEMICLLMPQPDVEEYFEATQAEEDDYCAQYPILREAGSYVIPPMSTSVGGTQRARRRKLDGNRGYMERYQEQAVSRIVGREDW